MNLHPPVEKCYFLSVAKVSYGRQASMHSSVSTFSGIRSASKNDTPTHELTVLLLKGAWTPSNRDIIFALYDSFRKTQQLKKNLSTASLKGFRCPESSSTPIKTRSRSIENQVAPGSPIQVSFQKFLEYPRAVENVSYYIILLFAATKCQHRSARDAIADHEITVGSCGLHAPTIDCRGGE